jgi:hypothetical protein
VGQAAHSGRRHPREVRAAGDQGLGFELVYAQAVANFQSWRRSQLHHQVRHALSGYDGLRILEGLACVAEKLPLKFRFPKADLRSLDPEPPSPDRIADSNELSDGCEAGPAR